MTISENNHDKILIDKFDRHINYVRISVTDRCDFRCIYCMPEEMKFVPRAQLLTLEETATIAKAFTRLGVKKNSYYWRRASYSTKYYPII